MNKTRKRTEHGRSMVEMLGVLAIVGVLSVGGVYGYGVAMKKHKANELLHQASMLATTISAKALTNDGVLPETITDFGNSGYDTTLTDNGTKFILTMKDIDSAVCDQLKKGGMVQGVACKAGSSDGKVNAEITYYKNLATNEEEGEKSPTGGKPECSPACQEGQQCIGGACAEVNPNTTNGCSKNSDCDDWCKTNGNGEKCYCSINAEITYNDSACYNNFTGHCAVATTRSGVTGGYTAAANGMTWWSAVNFCKAHNKSLVSLADLGITGGYQDDAYCDGSDCICGEEECTETFWSDLQSKIGGGDYWVTDAIRCCSDEGGYTLGTNNNSCMAFAVHPSSGAVSDYGLYRFSNGIYVALCK